MTKTAKKITGVPTEAAKAATRAKAKGPKAGSAMSNQSVKYTEPNAKGRSSKIVDRKLPKVGPDVITSVQAAKTGEHIAVKAGGDQTLAYRKAVETADLKKLAVVGASFKAVQNYIKTHKPAAKLATGLDGKIAPRSAEAAAASGGKPAGNVPAKSAPSAKKSSGSSAQRSSGDFAYKTGIANATREGTWTHHMVTIMQAHNSADAARKAHEKSGHFSGKKLDFKWANDKGFIKY